MFSLLQSDSPSPRKRNLGFLGDSIELSLDASKTGDLTFDSSKLVAEWRDSYLSDLYVEQLISANKPVLNESNKSVSFDGSSDYLYIDASQDILKMPLCLTNWVSAKTIAVVFTIGANPEGFLLEYGPVNSTFRDGALYFDSSGNITFEGNHDTGSDRAITGAKPAAGKHIVFLQVETSANNRAVELFLDNVSQGSFPSMGTSSIDPNVFYLGASQDGGGFKIPGEFTNANLHEVTVINRKLTDLERQDLHTVLRSKWRI